jgi:hypothetical protein
MGQIGSMRSVSLCKQTCLLAHRSIVYGLRQPLILGAMVFMAVFQSLLNATVFHGIGSPPFTLNYSTDNEILFNLLGAAYMLTTDPFIKLAFGQVQQIPTRRPIYIREI